MKTSTPCPGCQKPITIEHFEDFSSPFTMKCPHCRAKLKETKMTPWLLLLAVIVIPLLVYLGISKKVSWQVIFPSLPTMIVFTAFVTPCMLYMKLIMLLLFLIKEIYN
ncbi:hypothetical protein F3K44_32420 [Bacillus megaterium]|nr:hypothetical protein [Priestia megaterium]